MTAVADRGENILILRPGFPLYRTVCAHYEITAKEYRLVPERLWEADLEHMESLIDNNTRAILINNPSNPTGSNYSKKHLLDILALAHRYKLPIITDEIYADIVFSSEKFYALAGLTSGAIDVPILTCGGLAKQFLVPGWRMGWIAIHDLQPPHTPVLTAVREGANRLAQLILGATTVLQAALPTIFTKLDPHFYTTLNATLEKQAMLFYQLIGECKGLKPVRPQGAMYVMVGVDVSMFRDIEDDRDFSQKLLNEELVYVLPGACFHAPGFFRVVFCAPEDKIRVAVDRMRAFCIRHAKQTLAPQSSATAAASRPLPIANGK